MRHTNSSIQTWRKCQRLWKYKHSDMVRPEAKAPALRMGSAIHDALECRDLGHHIDAVFTAMRNSYDGDPDRNFAVCHAMVGAYDVVYFDDAEHWETIALEHQFLLDLPSGTLEGKLDKVARCKKTGQLYLWERKTSSLPVDNPAHDYWGQLSIDSQLNLYYYAVKVEFGEVPHVMYDVIRKPQHRPRKGEALEEFAQRVARDMIDKKDAYFFRKQVHATEARRQVLLHESLETVSEIENYRGIYPRNASACVRAWGSCEYLDVCCGRDSLDSPKFVQLGTPHPELDIGAEKGETTNGQIQPKANRTQEAPAYPNGHR